MRGVDTNLNLTAWVFFVTIELSKGSLGLEGFSGGGAFDGGSVLLGSIPGGRLG